MFKHRVSRNRFFYFIFLVSILSAFAYLATNSGLELYQLMTFAFIAIIPGRLVRYFWKDYFAGKKNYQRKHLDQAITRFERFIVRVNASPWIKWLMFFSYGLYSFNIEAVTLTYLGLSHLHKKDTEKAADFFRRSLEMDSQYAHAYYGVALVLLLRGNPEEAGTALSKAIGHGYPKMSFAEFAARSHKEFSV